MDFLYVFVIVEVAFCSTGSCNKKIWLPDWFSQETLYKMAIIFSICTWRNGGLAKDALIL